MTVVIAGIAVGNRFISLVIISTVGGSCFELYPGHLFETICSYDEGLISLSLSLALQPFGSLLIAYTVGRTPWTGDEPAARPQPAHWTAQTQNKCTQTSMLRVGLELTTPVFDPEKTVHALDRAATMLGGTIV
jgi:hypothetical protein